jgi:hypothetical protein
MKMKKMFISLFEELLIKELLIKININSEYVDYKLKKKLVKSFKEQNQNEYNQKMNEFFDHIHPY